MSAELARALQEAAAPLPLNFHDAVRADDQRRRDAALI
jgi:hypothetical protein